MTMTRPEVTGVPGVPETALAEDLIARLPENLAPAPWDAYYYPVNSTHAAAHAAAFAWGEREGVPMLDVDNIVAPTLADGTANPDGMHWAWSVHEGVGRGLARLVLQTSD